MTDLDFIAGLARTETDALGFIPRPALQRRIIEPGRYIIIANRHGRPRGYLLHGPPRWGKPLHIYQACVEPDYRLRTYARRAVQQLEIQARPSGATELALRCAADLEAVRFWTAIGFDLQYTGIGGRERQRLVHHFARPIRDSRAPIHFFTTNLARPNHARRTRAAR